VSYGRNTRHKTPAQLNKYGCIPRRYWPRVTSPPEKRIFWQKCALLRVWIKWPESLVLSGLRADFVRFCCFAVLNAKRACKPRCVRDFAVPALAKQRRTILCKMVGLVGTLGTA
ncbi:TPA: hypothetical protein ACUB6V_005327, partial [Klebsiella variicola]